MNLARLEIFVAVCTAGSFTRAAEQMAITKSAASQQVATLERELGVQLLHRSTRALAPTEAGATLLDEARALLAQAERLAERTRGRAAALTGVLRLTSAEDMAETFAEWVLLNAPTGPKFVNEDPHYDAPVTGDRVVDEKLRFFDQFPELVALRTNIRDQLKLDQLAVPA